MNTNDIKQLIQKKEYDFLRTNENLGDNIIMIGLGGSHAYGTNTETSDIDIRGIAMNCKRNILTRKDFEQVVETTTDTTIYSFDKAIRLFCQCNPNSIEILGLQNSQTLKVGGFFDLIIDNKILFLSQACVHTFGGYANAQLRRLEHKAARLADQSQEEINILKSIQHADVDLRNRYKKINDSDFHIYIDKTDRENYDTEIFVDAKLNHYPLRDFKDYMNDMTTIIGSYSKIGKRNEHAIEHNKLGKHMMHLVRLYYMCFDILEKKEINTYREKEHDLLMDIRNGKYLDENRQPIPEFYELVNELEQRLDYDRKNTDLPEKVDMKKVDDLVETINEKVVKGEVA